MGANWVCCCASEFDVKSDLDVHQRDCTQATIYNEHARFKDALEWIAKARDNSYSTGEALSKAMAKAQNALKDPAEPA